MLRNIIGRGLVWAPVAERPNAVCKALSLKMIDDAATRAVAQKIIEMAQSGASGADKLHSLALQEFQSE